ncbi:MAG: PAS domain S-box protein [Gemmatimonadota bacterium]
MTGADTPETPLAGPSRVEAELRERVKELRLLVRATALVNRHDLSLDERLDELVTEMPSAWSHPERTLARISLLGRTYASSGFRETQWMQSAAIPGDDPEARIDVALVAHPGEGEGPPFLEEEETLLESLARLLGDAVGRVSLQRVLEQTFASVQEAILVVGGGGTPRTIRYANPGAVRIFGYPADELVGAETRHLHLDEDHYSRFGRESQRCLNAIGTFSAQFPMRRKDGRVFEAEQTVSVLDPDLGHEGGVVSVVRDVSERVEAENRLRESEERFREIAERIEDAFWITDPEKQRMEYVSPAYTSIWGRPVEELLASPGTWLDAIVPADRERVIRAVTGQPEGPYEQEYRIRRPDGTERWILDRSFPVRDEAGDVVRVVGVAKDVTEHKRLEERFSILSQEITDVILVVSENGTIGTATPSVFHLTGCLREELEGHSVLEWIHPEDRASFAATLKRAIEEASDEAIRIEHRMVTKDGRVRPVESVARNLLGDPALEGILITSRDVSERVALEQRVRQMQKMDSVGQLAGGIAHDFNNILTAIRSQTDLLLMDHAGGETADGLRLIQGAADRAATLTSQLLAFSRDQILRPRVVDISRVARQAGELIDRVIGEDIELLLDLPEGLPPVRIDPNQLEQVILNLAVNARDAMPEGGTLSIAARPESPSASPRSDREGAGPKSPTVPHVVLSVADTGTGMTEDVAQRIFDPFFTTKAKGKGTGLGLAMVYGTVRQSGGSVRLDTRPGRGTTFHIRLPQAEGAPDPEDPDLDIDDGAAGGPLEGAILVVEDDYAVREAVAKVLRRVGLTVHEAESAEAGLALMDGGLTVDAVLSDLILPGMSGLRMIERLDESHPSVPVVLMSGYAEAERGGRQSLPRGVAFMQKPFTPGRMLGVLRGILRHD